MRYLSLCSGIEAATVAWHPMGWEPAAFAEIESFPAAVLRHHYPNTPNLGDMTKWREWNVGAIDLLVGGTPCQSFSVAGLRKGLSDPRGGLMLTFLEIAQSLRPRWVVWENVPGVLSSGSGRDFGSFLGALGDLGYGWAYRVLDAQWCRVDGYERAVPQRRRRVFVVGCFADATRAAQVLFERQSVERNPAARGKARQGAASDADGGVESGGCYWDGSDCAATLTKQNAGGGQRMPDKANFGAVLQPAATCFAGSSFARYDESRSASTIRRDGGDLGGGSETFVAVPFRKSHRASSATDDESWVRAETANTPNSFDTGERDTHAIAFTQNQREEVRELGPVTGALSGQGTHQTTYIAATIDMQACKGNANIGDGSVSPTLCKPSGSDVHAIAFAQNQLGEVRASEIANTLNTNCNASGRNTPMTAIAFTPGNRSRGAGPSPNSEVAPTQKCSAGRGADDQRTCVAFTCKDHGADASDVSPTLRAMQHDGSHANGRGQVAVAIDLYNQAIDGECAATLTQACGGTNTSGPKVMQVAHTLRAEGHDAREDGTGRGVPLTVAFHPTQDPISSTDGTTHAMGCGSKQGTATVAVATQMVVRRLTPVECERLQGFPDDYTNIPWRGKPESPDGPRYKALGNSMAVNCMRWIGRRIDAVEKGTELPP